MHVSIVGLVENNFRWRKILIERRSTVSVLQSYTILSILWLSYMYIANGGCLGLFDFGQWKICRPKRPKIVVMIVVRMESKPRETPKVI